MTDDISPDAGPGLAIYRAAQFRVVNGANLGDPLGHAEALVADDVYRLSPVAASETLRLELAPEPPFRIAAGSPVGRPGAALHFDCVVTLMAGDGGTTEGLVLVETDAAGDIAAIYLHPLGPLHPRTDYALVGIATEGALQAFAQAACVSFTRGTAITLATGAQCPVEDLQPGQRILTRDDGPQPLRWLGHATIRAVGAFAPVVIRAGTLHNTDDLVVSPDHRLFIYQRRDRLGAGRAELLVKARHLVNGDSVYRMQGGFVEYYQMLFDRHQIVYAEGIAAESMLLDTRTRAALPGELSEEVRRLLPEHAGSDPVELEVQESLLGRADAAELLRRSSTG